VRGGTVDVDAAGFVVAVDPGESAVDPVRDVGAVDVVGDCAEEVAEPDGRFAPEAEDLPGSDSATAAESTPADKRAPAAVQRVSRDTRRSPASLANSLFMLLSMEEHR
jgi:hypothetical protein